MPDAEILTPAAVAELFNVTTFTVSRWADSGKIPGFKTVGGHWRFHRSDIEPLLERAPAKDAS